MPLILVTGDIPALLSFYVSKLADNFDADTQTIPVPDDKTLWDELSNQSLWSDTQILTLTVTSPAALAKGLEEHKDMLLDTDDLVILSSPKNPVALKRAVESVGGSIKEFSRRNYKQIASELGSDSGLPPAVQRQIIEAVGQEVERIPSIVSSLKALPESSLKHPHVVKAYLGQDGGTPMWGVMDAIDAGNARQAMMELNRIVDPPIVVHSVITSHLQRILSVGNLSGLSIPEIAKVLGVKGSTYPLQKASKLVTRYKDIENMLSLCIKAGADLRGSSPLPADLILEILVGRLCLINQIGKA